MILLIHPPVSRPAEPPAGIARLCGALRALNLEHVVVDLNLEGMFNMLENAGKGDGVSDKWTKRAEKNFEANIKLVCSSRALEKFDAYKKAVLELDRLISRAHSCPNVRIGLSDYRDGFLSPLCSPDLLKAAREYKSNPFSQLFSTRLSGLLDSKAVFAGISVNYLSQALTAFAIAGFIRYEFPKIKIVMGGGLITSWMHRPGWKDPFAGLIDHLIAGPGENALLGLFGKDGLWLALQTRLFSFPLIRLLEPRTRTSL